MKKHVNITVFGRLQHSGLRFLIVEKALELNIAGKVYNYDNDKLSLEVEGEVEDLQKLLKWLHSKPENIQIKTVDYKSTEGLKNFENFEAEWFV